jgi:transcriptional regulator with XRE-family HTH domain
MHCNNDLATRLARLRAAGLSVVTIARRLGLPNPETGGRVTVTRWAKGLRTPRGIYAAWLDARLRELEARHSNTNPAGGIPPAGLTKEDVP